MRAHVNALGSLKRTFVFSLFAIMVVIAYTAYTTINGVFLEQSKIQQESASPIFSLIVDELLLPMHVAETLHKAGEFVAVMGSETIDEALLLEKLKHYEERFGLVFFVASETVRKQYFSDGKTLDLIEGEVAWYFQALEKEADFLADLGDVNNVHLFFDFKVYDDNEKLLGIVGVGKSLRNFLDKFQVFKAQHGYDFIFLNDNNEIMLSSKAELAPQQEIILKLENLQWYQQLPKNNDGTLNSLLVEDDGENYLLSEFYLDTLDWRVILMLPLKTRQNQLNELFVRNLLRIILVGAIFVAFVIFLSHYFSKKIASQVDIDHLSQLPNRRYVERKFNYYLKEHKPLSLVVVDIDHFKSINDNYGHNVGDIVIQKVSQMLKDAVRVDDIAARWGGEEFLLVLPGASFDIAQEVAERTRDILALTQLHIEDQVLQITASFGVTYSDGHADLADLVATADDALYKAKAYGRNRVEVKLAAAS